MRRSLQAMWATEIYVSDVGYIVMTQRNDDNTDSTLLLTAEQAISLKDSLGQIIKEAATARREYEASVQDESFE